MGISAVIITFNEEAHIRQCLDSLSFADEIVVLDSYSTDNTTEIVREYTDNLHFRKFEGFSDQRNAAIDLTKEEWILLVDADEVITDGLAADLQNAVKQGTHNAYRMPRLTYFLGRPIRHCGWYPDYQLRLALKSKAKIPYRLVHESMEVDGSCGVLKNDILHYSYDNLTQYIQKMVLYAHSAAEQKVLEKRKLKLSDLLLVPGLTFLKTYIARKGFLDGLHGFVLSNLSACSVFIRYAMLWEMTSVKKRKGASK